MQLPEHGKTPEQIADEMKAAAAGDADWRTGKTWSLVYNAGEDVLAVSQRAYQQFFASNALNPMAFPSLRRFETEILEMAAGLFHGGVGNMTTGGTESILMALKTARDWARAHRPGGDEVILPVSAHPAFDKAAHYLGLRPTYVPVGADYRVDVNAVESALSPKTILVVGSAPSFPQGVIDDIPALARLASSRGILCHVDACVGGYFLPFLERLGTPLPLWDFRVEGVTSISADLHKYGYCARGASTILYRDRALRKFQFHVQTGWPGGLYGSPTMTGSRAGGPIAAAWAVLNYLGTDGYLRLTRTAMEATRRLIEGVRSCGLRILGDPVMSAFAFVADDLDIYSLCDAMDENGWKIDRQQLPPSAHMVVSPGHLPFVEPFLTELRGSVARLRGGKTTPAGSAAMYGALAAMPDRAMVGEFLLGFMDSLDQT
jgi:glutamate/tyrosine decarboxylase-like PLP-dependent enzyme